VSKTKSFILDHTIQKHQLDITMKSSIERTKLVQNAEFSSTDNTNDTVNTFDRHSVYGGPVTSATIRFPPPQIGMMLQSSIDNSTTTSTNQPSNDQQLNQEEQYNKLKSQGRIIFSKGSWIESHPLSTNTSTTTSIEKKDDTVYKILAFGGNNNNNHDIYSSTMEGVRGMIFPSSFSSLSYSNDDTTTIHNKRSNTRSSISSLISIVAYGGRRLSLISGGGLWNNTNSTTKEEDDDFEYIPIINKSSTCCSYIEVSDWIHDVRLLEIDTTFIMTKQQQLFLIAIGMVNNNVEIWGFHAAMNNEGSSGIVLHPTRLQCITCSVRCMTYSLSFYGWNDDCSNIQCSTEGCDSLVLPSLVVASGTVFGEIIVWGAISNQETTASSTEQDNHLSTIVKDWVANRRDITKFTSRIRVTPSYTLKGHLGSIFAVKFSKCGNYIASTSDDRSVRYWTLTETNDSEIEDKTNYNIIVSRSTDYILSLQSSHTYKLIWTGWGHTARVWDVSYASSSSSSSQTSQFNNLPILVSAGEDGVARLWSPLSSEKEIAHPLRGHRCESLWTVDVCEGVVVTGGNDGSVKLFEIESRIRPEGEAVQTITIPEDPSLQVNESTVEDDKVINTDDNRTLPQKKKKKKKVKPKGQAICGIQFYGKKEGDVQCNLLIATRAGCLFSLDLASNSEWTTSSWSDQIVLASDNQQHLDINPSSGSCLGVHPSGESAVVGTKEGWLVITPIGQSLNHEQKNIAFRVPSYRPVQSISFTNDDLLLAFYARGVILFSFNESPTPLHILTIGTPGICISFAYNEQSQAMYVGDSRGNIAYFVMNQATLEPNEDQDALHPQEQQPTSLLTKVHGKEHVTGMTIIKSTGILVSVGNDGCLHQCKIDTDGQLQRLLSIPVPNVTGLRHVWNVPHPDNGDAGIIISGFYGNDFVVLDSINGYEYLRIATGGRQRQKAFTTNVPPNTYAMAILNSQKDGGGNVIDLHSSPSFGKYNTLTSGNESYSLGSSFHAETINDACWVDCWVDGSECTYLLTGSNDCSVRLSKFEGNKFVSTVELPPHESCVRGVCLSRHSSSSSSLLVTCGGKLSMEFYLLDDQDSTGSVSLLCSYRMLSGKTTSIDHRMNTVRAVTLLPQDKRSHLVVSGDSDGNLHVCIISELQASARKTTIGSILRGNGRPALCLELIRCCDKVIAFVGTTSGEISVWVFPGSVISSDNDDNEVHLGEGTMPTSPLSTFKAHQSGVNGLSLSLLESQASSCDDEFSVVVCSVGDDQALSTCLLDFTNNNDQHQLELKRERLVISQCASASALKAVKIIPDVSNGIHRVYTTGHDEKLTLWYLNVNSDEISLSFIASSPIGTEGCCIDCICIKQSDGSVDEIIAIGGEGVELQQRSANSIFFVQPPNSKRQTAFNHSRYRYHQIG